MTTPDIHACVLELTEKITHREPYSITNGPTLIMAHHTTTHPSLIAQLYEATEPSNTAQDGPRPAYGSKPTARLEAIDAAIRIDLQAAAWLRDLGHDDPGSTTDCIRHAYALAASAPTTTANHIHADIRRWWSWARILTGWDTPAWQPANTCPLCAQRGTLRIRLAHQTALCIGCWETWTPDNVGLLADHIRRENLDDTPTHTQSLTVRDIA